jgi:hypothetical protein
MCQSLRSLLLRSSQRESPQPSIATGSRPSDYMMQLKKRLFGVLIAGISSGAALAQSTLRELL